MDTITLHALLAGIFLAFGYYFRWASTPLPRPMRLDIVDYLKVLFTGILFGAMLFFGLLVVIGVFA